MISLQPVSVLALLALAVAPTSADGVERSAYAAGCGLPACTVELTEEEKAEILASIEEAQASAERSVEEASQELLKAIDSMVSKLKDGDKEIDLIEEERMAFVSRNRLPKARSLKRSVSKFETAVADAEKLRDKALDGLLKPLRKRDLSFWREAKDLVAEAKSVDLFEEPSRISELLPIGTRLLCKSGTQRGSTVEGEGLVVENDGEDVVIHVPGFVHTKTKYAWRFEAVSDASLNLVSVSKVKAGQKGGILVGCSGSFELDEDGLTGKYSWTLASDGKVKKGKVDWEIKPESK